MLVAVVVVLVVCLTLAAILIGVYFSMDGENNLVKVNNIGVFHEQYLYFVKDVNCINAHCSIHSGDWLLLYTFYSYLRNAI